MSAARTWGQLRDFRKYACKDPFHADLRIDRGVPRAGAAITLYHRYIGIRIRRVGRILIWREGSQFAFSDLSLRGPRCGFPHVMSCRIDPVDEQRCTITIRVRGLWTSRRLPRFIVRVWLWWVFNHFQHGIENEMLRYHLWQRSRRSSNTCHEAT